MMSQYQGAVSRIEETKKKMKLMIQTYARGCELPKSNELITRNKKGKIADKTKGE